MVRMKKKPNIELIEDYVLGVDPMPLLEYDQVRKIGMIY